MPDFLVSFFEPNIHQNWKLPIIMKNLINPCSNNKTQNYFLECLKDLQQPANMTEWEKDREKMEFERASKLYKPMNSILASRFVSARSHDISHLG